MLLSKHGRCKYNVHYKFIECLILTYLDVMVQTWMSSRPTNTFSRHHYTQLQQNRCLNAGHRTCFVVALCKDVCHNDSSLYLKFFENSTYENVVKLRCFATIFAKNWIYDFVSCSRIQALENYLHVYINMIL